MKPKHKFYQTTDADAPLAIRDNRGEVVLQMCRVCGQAEGELTSIYCDMPEAKDPDKIDGLFHLVPNLNVPLGVACVVHNDRVLYLGPTSGLPDAPNAKLWPDGAVTNLHPSTLAKIKRLLDQRKDAQL